MEMKSEEKYEDDSFYLELEKQMVELIDDNSEEEVKPTKKNHNGRRNYYNWSIWCNGPHLLYNYPLTTFSGTGVFIPQVIGKPQQKPSN